MRDPDQSVGFLANDVARLLRRNFNRRAQKLGLSQAQWQAITLARLIDRLQEAGLVARRPDPGDRRAFRLYLTAAARPLLDRMWDLAAETRAEAMAGLPDDRRQALIESLRHVKRNLVAAESGASGNEQPGKAISNAARNV